jgi:hypothetical protein
MNERDRLHEIREDIEAKQRATVWPDTLRNGSSVDAFLWKGDQHAKPIQRAGLFVFGVAFLLIAIAISSTPFQKKFEDGWGVDFLMAFAALLLSMRLLRNAFLRPPRLRNVDGPARRKKGPGHLE